MNLGDHLRSLRVTEFGETSIDSSPPGSRTSMALSQAHAAVVVIATDKRIGKGFIVGGDGRIVTNFHLVELASRIRVTTSSGDVFLGRATRKDMERELAQVEIPLKTPDYVILADSSSIDVGTEVFIPSGSSADEFVNGLIVAIRRLNGVSVIQLDVPPDAGLVGSPVFNSQGTVVGIVRSPDLQQSGNTTFALNVGELQSFLFAE